MENNKLNPISELSKDLIKSLANKVVLNASTIKHDSLSIGNFYQDFYELKINDLISFVESKKKTIKNSGNKKAFKLWQESFDNLMVVSSLRSEQDVLRKLFRANECINDALYLINEGKGDK